MDERQVEERRMEERLVEGVFSAICAAFYDTRRNQVCRIYIPGDNRFFEKFERMLGSILRAGWQEFLGEYGNRAVELAEWGWLHRYLQYQEIVPDLYDYALQKEQGGKGRIQEREFLQALVEVSDCYGAACGAGVSAREGVLVYSEKRMLTEEERRILSGFYAMILQVIEEMLREITPKVENGNLLLGEIAPKEGTGDLPLQAIASGEEAENLQLPQVGPRKVSKNSPASDTEETASDEEAGIATQILYNLQHKKLTNEEMWFHIRYCIDHGLSGCEDRMLRVSKNAKWRAWVRQTAVEYVCRFMEVGEICEKLLPSLNGKLFYWAIARLSDTRDQRLKDVLREYTECYTGQEMMQDICLTKMQDREGVKRLCRHLEKRRHMCQKIENPDPILVLGEIASAELMNELERLLDLMMRNSFWDRRQKGLQASLVSALSTVAAEGEVARKKVQDLLERKQRDYEERYLKMCESYRREYEEAIQERKQILSVREIAPTGFPTGELKMTVRERNRVEEIRKTAEKLAAFLCMAEDIRWRISQGESKD